MILNEITIDTPVYSVKGQIKIDLPQYQTRIILNNVIQVKGLGTHDAAKLLGTKPTSDHIYTLKILLKTDTPLSAEDIRIRAKGLRFFEEHVNKDVNKRPLSELLGLGIVEILQHSQPPTYKLIEEKRETATKLVEGENFGS